VTDQKRAATDVAKELSDEVMRIAEHAKVLQEARDAADTAMRAQRAAECTLTNSRNRATKLQEELDSLLKDMR
jgi:hypothetical protein